MDRKRTLATLFVILTVFFILSARGPAVATGQPPTAPLVSKAELPPYHKHPPKGRLPAVLPWREFAGNAVVENAYYHARRIRGILYQLPCMCYCSRSLGHTCLLDCVTKPDKHASVCEVCLKELLFAYQESRQGKSAKQIRRAIIAGKYENIDLTRYQTPPRP